MKAKDYTLLQVELAEAYRRYAPRSAAVHEAARQVLVDGGSHAIRLIHPFPPRVVAARGAWIQDEDGHDILDFWQGHLGNILGHNPDVVTTALARALEGGFGLHTGLVDQLQAEVAGILCQQTGAERVRLTTSGSLATMFAIMLARAYTGRDLVLKVGGGWHGAQPWGLKGAFYHNGFRQVDTEGLPRAMSDEILVTRFNDPEMLSDRFREFGDKAACFILEPVVGAGGVIPATLEYVQTARRLTQKAGALLILDEVITGFRFRAGDAGTLYGVKPDLATFGKIIGGGMPVAAVVGRAEVMDLVGASAGSRVKFSGGTYSAHPGSLLAAKTVMAYLIEHEEQVYPRLAELGERMRRTLASAFTEEGIYAQCTGGGNGLLPGSSLGMVHFPHQPGVHLDKPDLVYDPAVCDVALGSRILELALLLEDVHMIHAHGAVATAHTEADLDFLGQSCRRVARRIQKHR